MTSFDVPGAEATLPSDIDDRGQIVGYSFDERDGNIARGFVRQADGSFATVDLPAGRSNTTIQDIDDHGRLVGQYGVLFSGYVPDPRGRIETFDVPGVVTETCRWQGRGTHADRIVPTQRLS